MSQGTRVWRLRRRRGAWGALVALGLAALTLSPASAVDEARRTLDIFFVDVEGGAATLIVSPAGESVLIDSGFPGERDAARIARVARDEAGLERLDHYVTTHWHRDHVGGIAELVRVLPVARYYGHRIPEPLPEDVAAPLMDAWRGVATSPVWLKAGDRLPLRTSGDGPQLHIDVVAADGAVLGEEGGAPQVRRCDRGHEIREEDATDNARSLGFRVSYGTFDLFAGGDLTWNVEHKLVCLRPGFAVPVDAYLANHHGADSSNNPVLIEALQPAIAIVNSGPRKGAEPRTMQLLLDRVGRGRVFQLHRNVRDGAVNADDSFVANDEEACAAAFMRLTVSQDASRYTMAIPAKEASWEFVTK